MKEVNFRLNQIQIVLSRSRKQKDWIFSFQLKKKILLLNVKTDDARLKHVPHYLDLTRMFKS